MKVYIGPYKDWFGPYQLAEKLIFWKHRDDDEVFSFGHFLATGSFVTEDSDPFSKSIRGEETWLYNFMNWVHERNGGRKIKVRIDKYDTWSMDHTLAPIILPMLKQLRDTKHGYPSVDLEDVPEKLRAYDRCDDYSYDQLDLFDMELCNPEHISMASDRWDWVLNEMIFAFETCQDENADGQFTSGEWDTYSKPCQWDENGKATMYQLEYGPNHTYTLDAVGHKVFHDRIANGFRLFGKYYQALWD